MASEGVESKRPSVLTGDVLSRSRPEDEPVAQRQIRAGDLAAPLLAFLRQALDAPTLDYEKEPTQKAGGGQAMIFAFSLSDPANETEWGSVPLVCRVSRLVADHDQLPRTASPIGTVAAFQQALADLGYPAPRVVAAGTHHDGIGIPFLVMERMKGKSVSTYLAFVILLWIGLSVLWRCVAYTGWEPYFPFLAPPIPGVVGPIIFLAFLGCSARALVRLHRLPADNLTDILTSQGIPSEEVVFGPKTLDRLEEQIRQSGADELAPAVAWLRANLPSKNSPRAVCHFDHHPGNVMLNRLRISGVIDWTAAMVAEPECDIAWNRIVNIAVWFAVSSVPEPFRSTAGYTGTALLWIVERLQELLYRIRREVETPKVRYYTAYFSLLLLASGLEGLTTNTQDSGRGRRALRQRFRRATGLRLLPGPSIPGPIRVQREERVSHPLLVQAFFSLGAIAILIPPVICLDLMFTDAVVWFMGLLP